MVRVATLEIEELLSGVGMTIETVVVEAVIAPAVELLELVRGNAPTLTLVLTVAGTVSVRTIETVVSLLTLLDVEAVTGETLKVLLPRVMVSSVQVVVEALSLPEIGPTTTPLDVELMTTGIVVNGDGTL